jgi:hypothetical protein
MFAISPSVEVDSGTDNVVVGVVVWMVGVAEDCGGGGGGEVRY